MRARSLLLLVIAAVMALAACSADLSDVPMPDGAPSDTYRLEAEFTSALNLPRGAPVKLDGRVVGSVAQLGVEDYVAVAQLDVDRAVTLPVGTRAEVRLTAPVGEAFVALLPPETADAAVTLGDGDRLGVADTATAPDTIDLLTALSTAVTGGSYADIGTITRELSVALADRGDDVQHLFTELDELATAANANRATIDAALDSLDALAAAAAAESDSLATSLTELRPAIDVAVRLQDPLTDLLAAVTALSTSTQGLLQQTSDQIVAQVDDAAVVLAQIAAQHEAIIPILTGVSAFGHGLDRATPSDYATFDLSIEGSVGLGGDLPVLGGADSPVQIGPFTPSVPPIEQTLTSLLTVLGSPLSLVPGGAS